MWTGFLIAPVVFIACYVVALDRVQFFNAVANPWKQETNADGTATGDGQSLLFYVNMVHGLILLPMALANVLPSGEKLFMTTFFFNTYPTELEFPSPSSWVMRNIALLFVGMSVANVTAPTSTGVGVVGFFFNVLLVPIFGWACLPGKIHGLKNRFLWCGFLAAALAFAVLFAVALKEAGLSYDTSPWNVAS